MQSTSVTICYKILTLCFRWYNIPPAKPVKDKSKGKSKDLSQPAVNGAHLKNQIPQKTVPVGAPKEEADANSVPLDFNTFVPHHDPSLSAQTQMPFPFPPHPPSVPEAARTHVDGIAAQHLISMPGTPSAASPASGADEAFSNALGAMYWAGYWMAMYHSHRRLEGGAAIANAGGDEDTEEQQDQEDAEETEDLVSTQRS